MRRVLSTDRGGELYRKRNGMIEPVFANTKFNRRIDRFQRRGRAAASSEWRLTPRDPQPPQAPQPPAQDHHGLSRQVTESA
jgi:Transposase DDE domain